MEQTVEPSFDVTVDVVVAGLGTGGAVAAIAAAEQGMSVLGFDRINGMGGIGTLGSVLDYYYGQTGGVLDTINADCDRLMDTGRYVTSRRPELVEQNRYSYSGAVKSYAMEQRAVKAGVDLRYSAIPVSVYLEGNQIAGLRLWCEGKMLDVAAKVIIDATGNAQIAHLAGCTSTTGRALDNACAYYSKTWTLYWKEDYVMGLWINAGRIDTADAKSYAQTNLHAMRGSIELVGRHNAGQFRAVMESPLLGVREDRLPKARETVLLADFIENKQTNQPVFYAASHVDSGSDFPMEDDVTQDYQYICGLRPVRLTVPVPMGALIAAEVEGLLFAGRGMGADHGITGCLRMKYDMEKTGEAAAVIATIAVRQGCLPSQVAYTDVEKPLRESGCLQEGQHQPWAIEFPQHNADMLRLLSQDRAMGGALMSARHDPARWEAVLLEGLASDQPILRHNCALGLGLSLNAAALPMLRQMAVQEDDLVLAGKAICLLGRYEHKEEADRLLNLLRRPLTNENSKIANQGVYVCQAALMALARLIYKHKDDRDVAEQMRAIVFAPSFRVIIPHGQVDLTQTFQNIVQSL